MVFVSFSLFSLCILYSKERAAAAGAAGLAGGHHREAWATKGPSYEDLYTQNVVISMEDQEDLSRPANEGKPARERPIWLRESTVQGAYDPDEIKDGKGMKMEGRPPNFQVQRMIVSPQISVVLSCSFRVG